ncbi:hypothetical protein K439DRAFT_1649851 [Ramaria rubella]|nr:hypothetical protein K439DRAFT_1649851 [Ramaria rubella]
MSHKIPGRIVMSGTVRPGSGANPWETVKTAAIPTFEAAHPGCQALFVFDQSSAHAALPPDALKAFEMNEGNGGKQRHQKDTIIPDTNPTPKHCGKLQKMCALVCPFESQKCCMAHLLSQQDDFRNQDSMLETVIKDAGDECIFLPEFHCELNPIEMYWGWIKYRYRQVPKKSFEDAKRAAFEALDACPVDVIRCMGSWEAEGT